MQHPGAWGHPLRHWVKHRRQSEQCADRRLACACATLIPLVYLGCAPGTQSRSYACMLAVRPVFDHLAVDVWDVCRQILLVLHRIQPVAGLQALVKLTVLLQVTGSYTGILIWLMFANLTPHLQEQG